jgi:translocation and assembly module TamB
MARYENENVRLHDVDGGAQLHITPTELLFTALSGYLPGGGSAAGELRIVELAGRGAGGRGEVALRATAAVTTANKTAAAMGAKASVHAPVSAAEVGRRTRIWLRR